MEQAKIAGMSCQHCVDAVKEALAEMGLTSVEVDLASATATFTPTTAFSQEQVAAAIEEAGFHLESVL